MHLVARLRLGGYVLLDTQFLTEHLKTFGAFEISGREYLERLERALGVDATFPADAEEADVKEMLETVMAGN